MNVSSPTKLHAESPTSNVTAFGVGASSPDTAKGDDFYETERQFYSGAEERVSKALSRRADLAGGQGAGFHYRTHLRLSP